MSELRNQNLGNEQQQSPNNIYNDGIQIIDNQIVQIRNGEVIPISDDFALISNIRNIDDDTVKVKMGVNSLGKYLELNIPYQDLTKQKFSNHLLKYGVSMHEEKANVAIAVIMSEKDYIPMEYCHSNLGWSKYGIKNIYKHFVSIGFESSTYNGLYDITPTGDYKIWRNMIKTDVIGNNMLELATVLGFTAPVIGLLSEDALIVHICGESSSGKSTSTKLAVSAFGNPEISQKGLIKTWNGTENAILANLQNNFGVPIAFDEGSMKGGKFTNIIYNLASGQGRQRLNCDGDLKEVSQFRTTIISNAEISLLDNSSQNTGLKVRVLEVNGRKWTSSAENSDNIKKVLKNNYGHAGIKFVHKLMQYDRPTLDDKLSVWCAKILSQVSEKTPFTDRIAQKLAYIMLTGELVNEFLNLNIDTDILLKTLLEIEEEKSESIDIGENAYDSFMEAFVRNESHFINDSKKSDQNYFTPKDPWGKYFYKSGRLDKVLILPNAFKNIMKSYGFENTRTILCNWRDKGILETYEGRLTQKKSILKGTQTWVYCINIKDFDENDSSLSNKPASSNRRHIKKPLDESKPSNLESLFDSIDTE